MDWSDLWGGGFRVGGCFLTAVAGCMGISEGNDGGDFSKGVIARGFSAGPFVKGVPVNVVDLPSPGWTGKGHGTRWDETTPLAWALGLREGL